jgi:hypothetical protein
MSTNTGFVLPGFHRHLIQHSLTSHMHLPVTPQQSAGISFMLQRLAQRISVNACLKPCSGESGDQQ